MSTVPPPEATHLTRETDPTVTSDHRPGPDLGDGCTARVLRPLHRRGQVLGLVDDTLAPGGSDVTLVLTTYGPLSTHSVWHEHGLGDTDISGLAARARDDARRADALLLAVGFDAQAMPVVVVWGPDETAVPRGGRVRHDVMFLRGSDLKPWLRRYLGRGDAMTAADADSLVVRLRAYRTATRPH